jgi:hypothetical protein
MAMKNYVSIEKITQAQLMDSINQAVQNQLEEFKRRDSQGERLGRTSVSR